MLLNKFIKLMWLIWLLKTSIYQIRWARSITLYIYYVICLEVLFYDCVEWLGPTVGRNRDRLTMPRPSTWWSRDQILRYKPYLRDGSKAGRTRGIFLHQISPGPKLLVISSGPSLIIICLRTEAILSAIWSLSVVISYGDNMTGSATPKMLDRALIARRWGTDWFGHPEKMGRRPRAGGTATLIVWDGDLDFLWAR